MEKVTASVFECLRDLIVGRFGEESWQLVQLHADGLPPTSQRHRAGSLSKASLPTWGSFLHLTEVASRVCGHPTVELLEALGEFLVHYLQKEGYESWLGCPGKSLKGWLSNLNAIFQHLESISGLPLGVTGASSGKNDGTNQSAVSSAPRIYCQEDESADDGSLLLHFSYQALATTANSHAYLASVAKGFVSEVAAIQFGVDIQMKQLNNDGLHVGSDETTQCTSWSVSAGNPREQWKLYRNVKNNQLPTKRFQADDIIPQTSPKCPSTGMKILQDSSSSQKGIGLSSSVTKMVFPYHVIIDDKFVIQQVGAQLQEVLLCSSNDELIGQDIAKVFSKKEGATGSWSWKELCLQENQSFLVEARLHTNSAATTKSPTSASFKATAIHISSLDSPQSSELDSSSSPLVMLILSPELTHLQDLGSRNWTLDDIPVHYSSHRELVLAREHLNLLQQRQQSMEELGHSLERERNLLESLLPQHAVEGLRAGKTVEPMLHKDVTFFFSDIRNFTSQVAQLHPWQVIEMLNQLYCVMDFLATRMGIFKIETIGDAYVCCSGLPLKDKNHAKNVANFAVAVKHCCRHVLSPVDGTPLELRIGVHTGSAASGIVGTLNPRFCVFGDAVNTTARHESSGVSGKIHCSSTTKAELQDQCPELFELKERGLIEMKGKGMLTTFWLDGHENNPLVNVEGLRQLDMDIKDLLSRTNFKTNMGLEAHPSFVEVRQERIKRQQSILQRPGSMFSFGSADISSTNSLGSLHLRVPSSASMTRSGSTMRKIGSLAQVSSKQTKDKIVGDKNNNSCVRQPQMLVSREASDKALGLRQKRMLVHVESGGDIGTNKRRRASNLSLTMGDLQNASPTSSNDSRNASARLMMQLAEDSEEEARRGASGCRQSAIVEDSLASFAFPPIPDSI